MTSQRIQIKRILAVMRYMGVNRKISKTFCEHKWNIVNLILHFLSLSQRSLILNEERQNLVWLKTKWSVDRNRGKMKCFRDSLVYSTFQENVCSAPTELNGQKGHIFLKGTYMSVRHICEHQGSFQKRIKTQSLCVFSMAILKCM